MNTLMESLSATNALNYQITNTTTTNNSYSITLGNSSGFTNANNNTANDLIYLGGTTSLLIYGPNNGSPSGGTGTLGLGLASSGNFDVTSTNTTGLQIQAVISGAYGITKTGSGLLLLGAANTFSGSFAASAGTTSLYTNNALGGVSGVSISGTASVYTNAGLTNAINDTAAVTINGTTAELDLSGGTEVVGSLAGTSTTATLNIGDYTSSGTTYSGGFTVGDNTPTTTFAGIISGTHSGTGAIFTKQGSGVLVLSGANTYTGVTAITGGTLAVTTLANGGSTSGIGASSNAAANLLLGNGTTFQYLGAATSSDRLFTINGTAAGASASLDASGSGALTLTNTGSIAYGTTNQTRTLILTGTNTGANTLAATIADNGTTTQKTTVTKNGVGTWVLSGTNTYTGGTNINGGVLSLGSGVQALGGTGTVATVGTITFGGGTLQYSSSNNIDYSGRFSGGGSQPFKIDTSGQNVTYTNQLVSAGGTLAKLGGGVLSLNSGSSSYSGGTTVSAGTLLANGSGGTSPNSATGTGSVTVNSGGTLGGGTTAIPGTISGATTVASGGTITGGTNGGVGTLNLAGGLTINGTYVADIVVAGGSDKLAVTGNLNVTGGALSLIYSGTLSAAQYVLATYSSLTSTFGNNISFNSSTGTPAGYRVDYGTNAITLDAVPEPGTWAGGLLLVGTFGFSQRRRLKRCFSLAQAA